MKTDLDNKKRLTNLFYSLKSRGERTFTKSQFIEWYTSNEKYGCYYCGLEIESQRKLVLRKILTSKRFFGNKYITKKGKNSSGTRCHNFEVDRKNPNGSYSPENCVLACYFCNNDKSDVFDSEMYKKFIGGQLKLNPRYEYLTSLIK